MAKKIFGVPVAKFMWRNLKKAQTLGRSLHDNIIEKWLFENADILLPNSEGEMQEIRRIYKIKNDKYKPVCNAISFDLFKKEPPVKRQDFILGVGRIERRKNTLKLIEACHNLGYKLTLVGGVDTSDSYNRECTQKIKNYNFVHIPNISQKDLVPYYYQAKVHATVSWYETPGLATMEAACGGCNIVTTDRGSTKEYFGNLVEYCDPFSQSNITNVIKKSMNKKYNQKLRNKIMSNYTWEVAAEDTLEGYNKILNNS